MTVVLICGGRTYSGGVAPVLDALHDKYRFTLVVHGGAKGADALAGAWAKSRGIATAVVLPDWATHGKSAGPLRNQKMLDRFSPQLCIAFLGGPGTADMAKRATMRGVRVIRPDIDCFFRAALKEAEAGRG